MASQLRMVTICADDYGIAPGVGQAIRTLIAAGRLQATGCMVNGPHWPAEAQALRAVSAPGRFDVGLHLTLTDQAAPSAPAALAPGGTFPPLGDFLLRAMSRRLDRVAAETEIDRQLDAFEAAWGRHPDFIDGHHHVHQVPVVRDALLAVYERRLRGQGVWIRRCVRTLPKLAGLSTARSRAAIIAALGRGWAKMARHADIPGNTDFAGVRAFEGEAPYRDMLKGWLGTIADGGLIMCHPGLVDDALRAVDTVTAAREEEFRVLSGDDLPDLLAATGVTTAAQSERYSRARRASL